MRRTPTVPGLVLLTALALSLLVLAGCQADLSALQPQAQAAAPAEEREPLSVADSRPELEMPSSIALDPSRGAEIGTVFPIALGMPTDKVKTIAGMETIAREGELYFNLHTHGFNLHTHGQMFFEDIRGQIHQAEK